MSMCGRGGRADRRNEASRAVFGRPPASLVTVPRGGSRGRVATPSPRIEPDRLPECPT